MAPLGKTLLVRESGQSSLCSVGSPGRASGPLCGMGRDCRTAELQNPRVGPACLWGLWGREGVRVGWTIDGMCSPGGTSGVPPFGCVLWRPGGRKG